MTFLTNMLLGKMPPEHKRPAREPKLTKSGKPVRRTSTVIQGEQIRERVLAALIKIGGLGNVDDVMNIVEVRSKTTLRRHLERLCCEGKVKRIGGRRGRGGMAYWKVIDAS